MSAVTPWTLADAEEPLLARGIRGRMREAARQVLAALLARGFPEPTIEVRPATVRFEWHDPGLDRAMGASVDRAGVVRAWVWVESVTFGESGREWTDRGTDVARVVREFAVVAGFNGGAIG